MTAKRRRGYHIPGYNYCGPGTYYEGKEPNPINKIDEACRRHDKDPRFNYRYYNDADQDLIDFVENHWNEDPIAAGIISGTFRTKRFITPYKRYRLEQKGEDLPSNSLTNDSSRTTKQVDTTMRRINKYRSRRRNMGVRRTRKYSSKYSARRTSRRFKVKGSTYSKSFSAKIARVLNPSKSYEYANGGAITMPTSQTRSIFVDPHVLPIANRTLGSDLGLATRSRMYSIYQKILGDTITAGYSGQQFWCMDRKEYFKFSNFSNSTMFITAYWVKPKSNNLVNATPLSYMDPGDMSALEFSNAVGGAPADLLGPPNPVGNLRSCDRQVNINEIPAFKKYWKITRMKNIKLEPNDQTTLLVNNGSKLVNANIYGDTEITFGDSRLLLRVKTELTADGTIALTNNNKGYAFTQQTLVYYLQQKCKICPKINKQIEKYIENPTGTGINAGFDPKMVGDPVDDAGISMDDVS